MCGAPPPQQPQLGILQVSSTVYLEVASEPSGGGLPRARFQRPFTSPDCHLSRVAVSQRFLVPVLGFHWLEGLTDLKHVLLTRPLVCCKGSDRGCGRTAGEEVYGARSGRVPSAGTSVPAELPPSPTPHYADVFINLAALRCCAFRILWRLPHLGTASQ